MIVGRIDPQDYLRVLPVVEKHAAIQFRLLPGPGTGTTPSRRPSPKVTQPG